MSCPISDQPLQLNQNPLRSSWKENVPAREGEVVSGGYVREFSEREAGRGWVELGKESRPLNIFQGEQSVVKRLDLLDVKYLSGPRLPFLKWVLRGDETKKIDALVEASTLANEMMGLKRKGLDDEGFVSLMENYLKLDVDGSKRRFAVSFLLYNLDTLVAAVEKEEDNEKRATMERSMERLCFFAGMKGLGNNERRERLMRMLFETPVASSVAFTYFNGLFSNRSSHVPAMVEKHDAFIRYLISSNFKVSAEVPKYVLTTFIKLMPFPRLKSSDFYIGKILATFIAFTNRNPMPGDEDIVECFSKFKLGFQGLNPNSNEGKVIVGMLRDFEASLSPRHQELYGRQEYPFKSELRE